MTARIALFLCLTTSVQAAWLRASTAPDVAGKVAEESRENLQIHDGFAQEETKDKEEENKVKANKDLSALQVRTAVEVAKDEKKDQELERLANEMQVNANKDLSALQTQTAPDMAKEVAKEAMENIQIHDGFAAEEKKDEEQESKVKADKDLSALQLGNWKVALDKDLKTRMLIQTKAGGIKDPCADITCAANLACPAGFAVTEVEGHCCPYCVNPDIKLEAAITGAVGSNGGKASTFCTDVWCFPTMCTKTETAATSNNGACCSSCPE